MTTGSTKQISGKWIVIPLVAVTLITLTIFLIVKLSGRGAATRNYLALHQTAGLRDLEEGYYEDAVKNFTPVIEANAEPAAYGYRGEAFLQLERYELAESDFREAIRQEPEIAANYAGLGAALEAQGKTDQAVREYERAIKLLKRIGESRSKVPRTGDDLAEVNERLNSLLARDDAHAVGLEQSH